MARPVKVLSASDDVRAELRRRARGQANEHRERFRAGIILLRLNGVSIKDVAARMNTSTRTVSIWSSRFERSGLAGLVADGMLSIAPAATGGHYCKNLLMDKGRDSLPVLATLRPGETRQTALRQDRRRWSARPDAGVATVRIRTLMCGHRPVRINVPNAKRPASLTSPGPRASVAVVGRTSWPASRRSTARPWRPTSP
jgi:hypothetical protein